VDLVHIAVFNPAESNKLIDYHKIIYESINNC